MSYLDTLMSAGPENIPQVEDDFERSSYGGIFLVAPDISAVKQALRPAS
jgi:hypothetical protein